MLKIHRLYYGISKFIVLKIKFISLLGRASSSILNLITLNVTLGALNVIEGNDNMVTLRYRNSNGPSMRRLIFFWCKKLHVTLKDIH